MPFTPSHVAAALPFQRTPLVTSALVIGCMTPDFEYFLRFAPIGGFGHTLPGVFLLDLPMALVVLWLFHAYAKVTLYNWLPQNLRRRIQLVPNSPPFKNVAQFGLVLLSILIGIATHIAWDSFTHPGFWFYSRYWYYLHRTIQVPAYGPMEYIRVIQQASTVFGALVLVLWFWQWYRKTAPTQPDQAPTSRENPRTALFVVCIVALVMAAFRTLLLVGIGGLVQVESYKCVFERAVIMAIDAFCVGVVVYGAWRAHARSALQDA
jgi:hypothetical protein